MSAQSHHFRIASGALIPPCDRHIPTQPHKLDTTLCTSRHSSQQKKKKKHTHAHIPARISPTYVLITTTTTTTNITVTRDRHTTQNKNSELTPHNNKNDHIFSAKSITSPTRFRPPWKAYPSLFPCPPSVTFAPHTPPQFHPRPPPRRPVRPPDQAAACGAHPVHKKMNR